MDTDSMWWNNFTSCSQKGILISDYKHGKYKSVYPGEKVIILSKNKIIKGVLVKVGTKYAEVKTGPHTWYRENRESIVCRFVSTKVVISEIQRMAIFPKGLWNPIKDIDYRNKPK